VNINNREEKKLFDNMKNENLDLVEFNMVCREIINVDSNVLSTE